MHESRIAPADEFGVQYPIISSHELPPVGRSLNEHGKRVADWHHSKHPKAELLTGDPLDTAVRDVRMQWTNFDDHSSAVGGYHAFYNRSQELYSTNNAVLYVTMASAGHVPAVGLDFSGSKPREVKVSNEQREYMWRTGQIQIASVSSVRSFLEDYAIQQGLEHLAEGTIDKFLHTADKTRREELAHYILAQLIEIGFDPLRNEYRRAHQEGLIYAAYPSRIERYVKRQIITSDKRLRIVAGKLQFAAARHFRVIHPENYPEATIAA